MQLKFAVPETELREMLVSTVILLYELEEKGIEISSITHSNCLLEGG
jgi:hypothetical protein